MNTALILIPALLVYLGGLYWLFNYCNLKTIWRGDDIQLVQNIDKPMINFVKSALDFFMGLLLIIGVLIIPIAVVMTISQGSSNSWGADISIFAGFKIDLNAIAGIDVTGLRNPEMHGKTEIAIDTSNVSAFYLFMGSQAALTFAGLYGVSQLRSLAISLKKGNAFSADNATRLKRIGLLVIIWNLVSPVFQYFAWGSVINDINFSNQGFSLFPAFEFNVMAIFIGALMMILSDLFVEATLISQEQRLTI